MTKVIENMNKWLNSHIFLLVVFALLLGVFIPVQISGSIKNLSGILLAYMMFITSLGTNIRSFINVLKRPWIPLYSLLLVHVASPLIAWLAGCIFFPGDSSTRIGLIIAGSIPLAVTSIIWTSLADGNVAISVVAVTLDTFIVPFLFPMFLLVLLNQSISISYTQMVFQLFWMVTLPSICGMLLKDYFGSVIDSFSAGIGGFSAKITQFVVIFINASVVAPYLKWSGELVKVLLVAFAMVVCGFFLGYLGSFAIKKKSVGIIPAMIYCVGMRNNSFGLVLALSCFKPVVAIPITSCMLFQQPVAALVHAKLIKKEKNNTTTSGQPV
jgi:predicted Na+-dependent transporter